MIFYVTNNIERAVGIDLDTYPDMHIISNASVLAVLMKDTFSDRISLNDEGFLSTLDLVKKFSSELSGNQIIVFKNTIHIQRVCEEHGIEILNPDAALVKQIEDKLTQYEWLQKHLSDNKNLSIPKTIISELGKTSFEDISNKIGASFVLQYNTGHTGTATKIISTRAEFIKEQERFPRREARMSSFISGKPYTVVASVMPDSVICSEISLQLTGLPEYTDTQLATVGNDWFTAQKNISSELEQRIKQGVTNIGDYLREEGWKGLFGIDIMVEGETQIPYLIEINARQQQSVSFETQLAHIQKKAGPMDWHLNALAGVNPPLKNDALRFLAIQYFLRKESGAIYEQYKEIAQVGEYDAGLTLIEEKPFFNLPEGSTNQFLIPQATKGEVIRIQRY